MRCKIGDECYVTRAHSDCAEAIGRIVKIVGSATNGDDWEIVFIHGKPKSLMHLRLLTTVDSGLIPIRGDLCKDEELETTI